MKTEFRNIDADAGDDTALELQVNGDTWTISPEPEQLLAFTAALVALQEQVEREELDAAELGRRVPPLLRQHLLGPYAEAYATLPPGKKFAICTALYEVFVGDPVAADPTPGPSGPTAPPAGDLTGSPGCVPPPLAPSPAPSAPTSAGTAGASSKPLPPPSATSATSSPSFETVPVLGPPSGSMSHSNSATSGEAS